MAKNVRKVLKERANNFTEKIVKSIRDSGWKMVGDTTSLNLEKLENTVITLKFRIKETELEEIKQDVERQRSLLHYSGTEEAEVEEE